jgi:RNA polymerase sigma-70 factor (ECF subfamily)
MEDKKIIELYFARNESAIAETDRKYGGYCHRIALNLLHIREDAEECVNDTYLATWNRVPPENPRSLSAFLGRILRNIAISRFRRDHARKRFDGMELLLSELEDCIPSSSNVESTIEENELSEIISDWLEALPINDRALFIRRYYHGESIKALAKISGNDPTRLSSRLFILRKKLKQVLEEKGVCL